MTTTKTPTPADGIAPPSQEYPNWSNLPDPEPIEDGMRQYPTISKLDPLIATHFARRPDALIGREGFLCWDPYDYDAKLAPDWIIAFGIDVKACLANNGYLIWRVGKPPDVIIEVATASTADDDLGAKRDTYAQIGVPEYWRLDPSGGVLYGESLVGERLVDGEYQRLDHYKDADDRILSHSLAMNIDIYWDGANFGIYDPVTRKYPLGLYETRRENQAIDRAIAETRAALERELPADHDPLDKTRVMRERERQAIDLALAEQRAIREQERQAARRALVEQRAVYERELQAYRQTASPPSKPHSIAASPNSRPSQ